MIRLNIHNTKLTSASTLVFQQRQTGLLVESIENYDRRAINSIESLKVENEREIIKLLYLSHSFVHDLQYIIDRIQFLVIKNYNNGHTQPELSKIATTLSNYTNSNPQSYTDDPSVLKKKLSTGLGDLVPQTRNIQKIIENSSDGAFRHDVIVILNDTLFAVQRAYFYVEYDKKSTQELKDTINKVKNHLLQQSVEIYKTDPESIRDFNLALQYSVRKARFILIKELDEQAMTYEGESKHQLLQASHNIKVCLENLDIAARSKEDLDEIQDHLKLTTRICHNVMLAVASLANPNSPDRKISISLHNLIVTLTSTHRAAVEPLLETMEFLSKR